MGAGNAKRPRLQIVVERSCPGCETARGLAALVRASGPPGVDVELIDLTESGVIRPAAVFAVPTYLLDGRVLCLGNPEAEWLLARLDAIPAAEEVAR
jgi:hypothetical protein